MSKATKSLDQKMAQLDELVAWFDSDEFALEQAIKKFHEAEKLAGEIDEELTTFKNEIQVLKQRFDQD